MYRHVLPELRALNFVVQGLLGEGVASQARFDPQAKALGRVAARPGTCRAHRRNSL